MCRQISALELCEVTIRVCILSLWREVSCSSNPRHQNSISNLERVQWEGGSDALANRVSKPGDGQVGGKPRRYLRVCPHASTTREDDPHPFYFFERVIPFERNVFSTSLPLHVLSPVLDYLYTGAGYEGVLEFSHAQTKEHDCSKRKARDSSYLFRFEHHIRPVAVKGCGFCVFIPCPTVRDSRIDGDRLNTRHLHRKKAVHFLFRISYTGYRPRRRDRDKTLGNKEKSFREGREEKEGGIGRAEFTRGLGALKGLGRTVAF